jgi:hypothetical protein
MGSALSKNAFYFPVIDSGVAAKLNEEMEKLTRDDRELATLSEVEQESVLSYVFFMKDKTIEENKLKYSISVLLGMFEVWVKKGDDFEKGKRVMDALHCLCMDRGLTIISFTFNSFLSLFCISS